LKSRLAKRLARAALTQRRRDDEREQPVGPAEPVQADARGTTEEIDVRNPRK
jgi:hypothetical protein